MPAGNVKCAPPGSRKAPSQAENWYFVLLLPWDTARPSSNPESGRSHRALNMQLGRGKQRGPRLSLHKDYDRSDWSSCLGHFTFKTYPESGHISPPVIITLVQTSIISHVAMTTASSLVCLPPILFTPRNAPPAPPSLVG